MEITVEKVELTLTNNGTPKVLIYSSNAESEDINEAIEIIGDLESLYALTRKKGDKLVVIQKGKWNNLQVDEAYLKAFNSPSYDRIKTLFKRSLVALNKSINGTRTEIEFDAFSMLVTDNLDLFLKTQEYILDCLKKSKTEFAKQLISDIKSNDTNVSFNAWKIINDLTQRNITEVSKDYRITNGEEPSSDTKKSKK